MALLGIVRILPRLPHDTVDHHCATSKPCQVPESLCRTFCSFRRPVIQRIRPDSHEWGKGSTDCSRGRTHLYENVPCLALRHQSSHLSSYSLPTGGDGGRRVGYGKLVRMVVWLVGVCSSDISGIDVAGKTVEGGNDEDGNDASRRQVPQHCIMTVVYARYIASVHVLEFSVLASIKSSRPVERPTFVG